MTGVLGLRVPPRMSLCMLNAHMEHKIHILVYFVTAVMAHVIELDAGQSIQGTL